MRFDEGYRVPADRPAEFLPGASLLVSCFQCRGLHRANGPWDFNPICLLCAGSHPLATLGMDQVHPLTHAAIDAAVTRTSPGNYALGFMDGDAFMVFYVGRSDSDVRRELHRWVGTPSRYVEYASFAKAAWGSRQLGIQPLDAPALDRVQACADSSYTHYAYSYADSAESAFEKECRNFEDFGGRKALDNEADPSIGLLG